MNIMNHNLSYPHKTILLLYSTVGHGKGHILSFVSWKVASQMSQSYIYVGEHHLSPLHTAIGSSLLGHRHGIDGRSARHGSAKVVAEPPQMPGKGHPPAEMCSYA